MKKQALATLRGRFEDIQSRINALVNPSGQQLEALEWEMIELLKVLMALEQ